MEQRTLLTGGRRLHAALSAARVRTVSAPGRYYDGEGLFLLVEPSGAKRWKQRVTVRGKRHELGLGPWPVVSLAEAREAALENRRKARKGTNPKTARRRARATPTFEAAARKVFDLRRPGWRNAKHAEQWIGTLEQFVFTRFGAQAVDEVTAEDVLSVLTPLWHAMPTTAKRVRQRIGSVLRWAVAQGYRADNPADSVREVLPRKSRAATPQRSLPYGEVADAITTVKRSRATPALKLAFEFLVLTAARVGEVQGATWDEIDSRSNTWAVPPNRMKGGREHRVPLSESAVAILDRARALGDGSGLVFPGRQGQAPLGNTAIVQCLKRLGIDSSAHGFRASFRVWAQERTGFAPEVCAAALAHAVADRAEAPYARSDLFDKRRELMEAWARYLHPGLARIVYLSEERG